MTRSVLGYALATYLVAILLLCGVALALSGCSTTSLSSSPTVGSQQLVYSAETDFQAALRIAVAYEALPACPASGQVCADPSTVTKVTAAAKAARASLSTAEAAVRSSTDATAITTAALQAQSDVATFQSLANALSK